MTVAKPNGLTQETPMTPEQLATHLLALLAIVLAACSSPRADLRHRCAPAFQHAYETCTSAPQPCAQPDCVALCESERLNDPAKWLGSSSGPDCYDEQHAWVECNEAVTIARCDCSAEYAAVMACAPR